MRRIPFLLIVMPVFLASASSAAIKNWQIEEQKIQVIPEVQITLPQGAIDVFLKERIKRTTIDFGIKYDFFDNYIHGRVDMRYDYERQFIGLNMQDNIDFDELIDNYDSLQRSRHFMTYYGWKFGKHLELSTSLKNEEAFTIRIATAVMVMDRGKNYPVILGMHYYNMNEVSILPRGTRANVDLTGPLGILGGDYNYIQLEGSLVQYVYPLGNNFFRTKLQFGYPLFIENKPLTAMYKLGGYNILRGYDYKEFEGNSMIYFQTSFHIPVMTTLTKGHSSLEIVTGDLMFEFGKTGETDIFARTDDIRGSVGIGFGCSMTLFKNVKSRFNIFISKAFEPREPAVYFVLKTLYYTPPE